VGEKSILIERKQYYFPQYQNKYNISPAAASSLGTKLSFETRQKISETKKGYRHSE